MVWVGSVEGTPAEDKAVISLPHFLDPQGLLRDQDIWQGWGESIGYQDGVGVASWGGLG